MPGATLKQSPRNWKGLKFRGIRGHPSIPSTLGQTLAESTLPQD